MKELLHPNRLDIDRLLLLEVSIPIFKAAVQNFSHHRVGKLLPGGKEDAPKEVPLGVLPLVYAVGVEEPHKGFVVGHLVEDKLHGELGVCGG